MNVPRTAGWASAAVVAAAVIAGFVISGSPEVQRQKRLDDRRVSHLQQLTAALDGYWHDHGTLPEELSVVLDGRRLSHMPSDPVTGLGYPYEWLSPSRYRLCAEFAVASQPGDAQEFWSHPAGRECYEFDVTRNGRESRVPLPSRGP